MIAQNWEGKLNSIWWGALRNDQRIYDWFDTFQSNFL
jgi:hypothetical protein